MRIHVKIRRTLQIQNFESGGKQKKKKKREREKEKYKNEKHYLLCFKPR